MDPLHYSIKKALRELEEISSSFDQILHHLEKLDVYFKKLMSDINDHSLGNEKLKVRLKYKLDYFNKSINKNKKSYQNYKKRNDLLNLIFSIKEVTLLSGEEINFLKKNDSKNIIESLQSISKALRNVNIFKSNRIIQKESFILSKKIEEKCLLVSKKEKIHYNIKERIFYLFTNGSWFVTEYQELLKDAIISIADIFNPVQLIESIYFSSIHYEDSQILNCLIFIKNYLTSSFTLDQLPSVNPTKSEFLYNLIKFLEREHEKGQFSGIIDEILKLSAQKLLERETKFKKTISSMSPQDYLDYIRGLSQKILQDDHFLMLEEHYQTYHILLEEAPINKLTIDEEIEIDKKIQEIISFLNTLPKYHKAFQVLRDQFLTCKTDHLKHIPPYKKSIIANIMNEIAEKDIHKKKYEELVQVFTKKLQASLCNQIKKINFSELNECRWTTNESYTSNQSKIPAPFIKEYQEYNVLLSNLIKICIFFKVGLEIQFRKNLKEIKKIHLFIEKALILSSQLKYTETEKLLKDVLGSQEIKRLSIESPLLQETSSASEKEKPFLELYQDKLKESYISIMSVNISEETNHEKEILEKISNIGKILKQFEYQKKKLTGEKEESYEKVVSLLRRFPVISDDLKTIDHSKLNKLIKESSLETKPLNEIKIRKISSFKTLHEIKIYLEECAKREYIPFKDKYFKQKLKRFIFKKIKHDNSFSEFNKAIDIANFTRDFNLKPDPFYLFLGEILSVYLEKAKKMLSSKNKTNAIHLQHFFSAYMKNEIIEHIRKKEKKGFFFSPLIKAKKNISLIDKEFSRFQHMFDQENRNQSQIIYTQLLDQILSGKSFGLLKKPEDFQTPQDDFLSESEFMLPEDEPEHPTQVGLNRTMNFSPALPAKTLSQAFNTEDIMEQFITAFPWATKLETVDSFQNPRLTTLNLIGSAHLLPSPLQIYAIEYLLLSLDIIGKIAGEEGEFTIQNFTILKYVIDNIFSLSQMLKSPPSNNSEMLSKIKSMISDLRLRNAHYFDMITLKNPPMPVVENPIMNGFCHLNEHVAHQLLALNYKQSFLTPKIPPSPYYEKIRAIFK